MTKNSLIFLKNKKYQRYLIAFIILILLVIVLMSMRVYALYALRKRTLETITPIVATMIAKKESGTDKIVLPGNVWAWHEAPIYARTNGYIKNWYVDIGSKVKNGDLLAVIETPELDAQARQAAAELKTAIANNNLAQTTARRWRHLLKTHSVSKQETDEKVSNAQAFQAMVASAKANLQRLNQLVSFEQVIAPFEGIITARATDIGDLINAGSSTAAKPLFRIAQTDPLRIYVKIPQYFTSRITKNMTVSLHFAEQPNHAFTAKLLDTAMAIDPVTRTLLAQFLVENKKGELLPGSYTEVWFTLPLPSHSIRLPVNTLLFQAAGLQVATVNQHNKIALKSVVISRDFGDEVEIATGVQAGERIVLNPPDAISDGELVRIMS